MGNVSQQPFYQADCFKGKQQKVQNARSCFKFTSICAIQLDNICPLITHEMYFM